MFFTKDSLKQIALNKIKKDYNSLYNDIIKFDNKKKYRNLVLNYNSYKVFMFFFMPFFLGFCLIDYGFLLNTPLNWLNLICLDYETSKSILDQRISNISTIIGVSLTISTILINNLGDKKKENYEILFQKTFIYPIVYYALGVLFFLICFSLFRESFSVNYEYVFINAVILGHYLILLLLLLIGYLFSQLIKFFNPEHFKIIQFDNFKVNVKQILYNEALKFSGRAIYQEKIEKLIPIVESDFFSNNDDVTTIYLKEIKNSETTIVDVKIDSLVEIISNISKDKFNTVSFYKTRIFGTYSNSIPIFDFNKGILQRDNLESRINKCFKKRSFRDEISYKSFFKLKIDEIAEKLEISVKDNNHKDLKKYLAYYEFIYTLYFDNLIIEKDFTEYENSYLLANRNEEIFSGIRKASDVVQTNVLNTLIEFCSNLLSKSITANSSIVFMQFLALGTRLFVMRKNKPQLNDYFLRQSVDYIRINIVFNYGNRIDRAESKSNDEYNYHLFSQYSYLIFLTLKSFNETDTSEKKDFEYIMKEFKIDFNQSEFQILSFEDKIQTILNKKLIFIRHILFATHSWLCFLLYKKKISTSLFLELIHLVYYITPTTEILLNEYISIIIGDENGSRWYLNFGSWDNELRTEGKAYTPLVPSYWLSIGFVFQALSKRLNPNIDFSLIFNIPAFNQEISLIFSIIENIENNLDDWLEAINCENKEEFQKRKQILISILSQLQKQHDSYRKQTIAIQKIDQVKVNNFKADAFQRWRVGFKMLSIFELFNNMQVNKLTDAASEDNYIFIGYRLNIPKETFIENSFLSNISDYGTWVGNQGDDYFLEEVNLKAPKSNSYLSIKEALIEQTEVLKQNGFQPNVIILPLYLSYSQGGLETIPDFERVWDGHSKRRTIAQIGTVGDNIMVIGLLTEQFKNQIIIADFAAAIKLEIGENEAWEGERLIIEVKELNQKEKTESFNQIKEENISLTDEEITLTLENKLILEIGCLINYQILNSDAIIIIPITI